MPAYLIVIREEPVRDPDELALYNAKARQLPRGEQPMIPRVFEGAVTTLEGPAPNAVVVLEFESVEAAKAWYERSDYQAVLTHRKKGADHRVIIAEGFAPPKAS